MVQSLAITGTDFAKAGNLGGSSAAFAIDSTMLSRESQADLHVSRGCSFGRYWELTALSLCFQLHSAFCDMQVFTSSCHLGLVCHSDQ